MQFSSVFFFGTSRLPQRSNSCGSVLGVAVMAAWWCSVCAEGAGVCAAAAMGSTQTVWCRQVPLAFQTMPIETMKRSPYYKAFSYIHDMGYDGPQTDVPANSFPL